MCGSNRNVGFVIDSGHHLLASAVYLAVWLVWCGVGIGNVASLDFGRARAIPFSSSPSLHSSPLPSFAGSPREEEMNYGKKDEDADTGLVKIDRTQVFQEGELPPPFPMVVGWECVDG